LFEAAQYRTDAVLLLSRMNQQVSVLGHDHVGPEVEVMFAARVLDSVDHPFACSLFGKKRLALETAKRK